MTKSTYDLIDQATELFKLRMISETQCEGLLYPTSSVWSYGRPAVSYYGTVSDYKERGWLFHSAIHSIDDSSCVFHSNYTTYEKAMKQLSKFVEWIESLEYACPTREQIAEYCRVNGYTPDYN